MKTITNLGWGECAAMILAEELEADQLLIDDLEARRVALSRKFKITGTLAILSDSGTRRLKFIYHKLFMLLAPKSSLRQISLINNNS